MCTYTYIYMYKKALVELLFCSLLRCVPVRSVLQCVAVCCSVLQCVAVGAWCSCFFDLSIEPFGPHLWCLSITTHNPQRNTHCDTHTYIFIYIHIYTCIYIYMCIYIYRSIFMFWLTSPVSLYNDTRSIMKHTL